MLATSGAIAGKVNIPKEGNYAFDFCPSVRARHSPTVTSSSTCSMTSTPCYGQTRPAVRSTVWARAAFGLIPISTANSPRPACARSPIWTATNGGWTIHGNPDGAGGTYTAAGGTGKYDGMVLKGEYRLDNNWGSPSKEVAFLGCNPNKGTYKLK